MLEKIMPLLSVIYTVVEAAIQEAIDYFSQKGENVDGWCFSSLVRYRMKVALNKSGYAAKNEDDSENEGKVTPFVGLRLEGVDVYTHYLMNNGLLLEYKNYRIRILKRHPRNLSCGHDDPPDIEQMSLDLDWGDPIPQHLLIVWEVGSRFQLVRLELIKPLYRKDSPAQIEWSVSIPHPAELIEGESLEYEYMYDPELPVLFDAKGKKREK